MAITDAGTALQINTLLCWLLPSANLGAPVPRAAAMSAAQDLASKAHRHLCAGPGGTRVRESVAIDEWRFDLIDGGGH
ncbi:hypothetical protein [uncultured Xanthomonas sp.]|uniref:hypothetical protein n=1 Tax=uncultured Xanthomonas sp. TaxID=152831 RepID=UPI0025EAAE37|nr:hypothetical protein [uncultured Xanthomonas sp.]